MKADPCPRLGVFTEAHRPRRFADSHLHPDASIDDSHIGIVQPASLGEALLSEANAAYMGLKLNAHSIRGRGANVFTQWVGDPDALGSAILLRAGKQV